MAVHQPTPIQQRVLSVLVENRSGVLSHVVGLFSARGFNIDSLAVGETEDATMSRITLVVKSDAKTFEQIKKQLNKLIDVIKVQDLTDEEFVDKELMLVKFKADEATEKALSDLCKRYRMSIVERGESVIVVESTESHDKTRELFELFRKIGIAEIARTGVVALSKKPAKN